MLILSADYRIGIGLKDLQVLLSEGCSKDLETGIGFAVHG